MGVGEMEPGKREPIQTFVFLDLEATGLRKDSPRIVELSMIAVSRHHLLEMTANNNNNNTHNLNTAANTNFDPSTPETGVDSRTHLAGTNNTNTANRNPEIDAAKPVMNSCSGFASVNPNFGATNTPKPTADLVNVKSTTSKTALSSTATRRMQKGAATNAARPGANFVNIAADNTTIDAKVSATNLAANMIGRANTNAGFITTKLNQTSPEMNLNQVRLNQIHLDAPKLNQSSPDSSRLNQIHLDATTLNQTCPETANLNRTYLDATNLNQTAHDLNQGSLNSPTLNQTCPNTPGPNQTALKTAQSPRRIPALPRILHKYTRLYYPWKLVPPVVERINGLNNESLEHLPGFTESSADAIGLFLDFPKPVVLIAHNGIGYDFPLLLAELVRVGRGDLLSGVRLCDSLSAIKDIDSVIEKEDVAEMTKLAEEFCDFDLDLDMTADLSPSVPLKRRRSEDETDFLRHSQLDARTGSLISVTEGLSGVKECQNQAMSSALGWNISPRNQMQGNGVILENALTAQMKQGDTAENKPGNMTPGVNVASSNTPQRTMTFTSTNNPDFTSPDRAQTQNRMPQTPTRSNVYRHPNTPPHTPTTPNTKLPPEQGQQYKTPPTPRKFKPYTQPNTPPHTPATSYRQSTTPHKQPTTPSRTTTKLASELGQQRPPPTPVKTGHVITTTPPDGNAHGTKKKVSPNVRRNLSQEYGKRKWSGVSYKQGCIYRRLFKASYPNHRAECDTEALLLICGHYGEKFVEWADTFAVDVSRVKPMWMKRSSFDTK